MSRFGDIEAEPVTFLATRLVAATLVVVAVGTAVGDPLWLSLSFGFAVGGAYAIASYLLRRVLA